MTPAQQAIRDAAIAAALEYGYDATALHAPPGKFEGEPFYVLYFYEAVLNGKADEPLYEGDTVVADLLEVSDDERAAFKLNPDTAFVALWYAESGFVTLDELTAVQYDELRDAYSDEPGETS